MKSYGRFFEDIDSRRLELVQRKREQMSRLKQQNAQSVSDAGQRLSAAKEKGAADQKEIDARKTTRGKATQKKS